MIIVYWIFKYPSWERLYQIDMNHYLNLLIFQVTLKFFSIWSVPNKLKSTWFLYNIFKLQFFIILTFQDITSSSTIYQWYIIYNHNKSFHSYFSRLDASQGLR